MKGPIAFTLAMAFLFGFIPIGNAVAGEAVNASQFCKANGELGYSSHGKCVSILLGAYERDENGPVYFCKEFLNNDPEGFYTEYNNIGECISHLVNGYVSE
jgi:hypothetical protein